MAPPKCFNDKCRWISSIVLVTLTIFILIVGGLIYQFGYSEIKDKTISGAPYLPELSLDFSSFSFYVFMSAAACVGILIFGLMAAQVKKPATAVMFILVSIIAGGIMLYSSQLAGEFEATVDEAYYKVCNESSKIPTIEHDYKQLVNQWLCTSDCKCYEGDNGEIKELWQSYGDSVLNPYLRNAGDKNQKYGDETAYPFKWTSDKVNSFRSFKQCYEEVLKPRRKFEATFQAEVESFFDGGGYDFLEDMEQTYDDCASACVQPLFFLSHDIAKGMPKNECVGVALNNAKKQAQDIALMLMAAAGLTIFSLFWSLPLCSGYDRDSPGDITQVHLAEDGQVEIIDFQNESDFGGNKRRGGASLATADKNAVSFSQGDIGK